MEKQLEKGIKKAKVDRSHLKRKTSEIVYYSLKEDILSLLLPPGSAVSEIETATKYHVSRTPVRDAFKALESEGLLEVQPHIGTFVSRIDLNKVSDMIFMRESLELTVLKILASTCTQSQLLKIRLLLKEQETLLTTSTSSTKEEHEFLANRFLTLDNEFHYTLFKMAGKGNIWEFMTLYNAHYERFRMLINWSENHMLPKLYEQHCELVDALAVKDMETLESLITVHLNSGFASNAEILLKNSEYFEENE